MLFSLLKTVVLIVEDYVVLIVEDPVVLIVEDREQQGLQQ
jgi:hypothetical protein